MKYHPVWGVQVSLLTITVKVEKRRRWGTRVVVEKVQKGVWIVCLHVAPLQEALLGLGMGVIVM